MNEDTCYTVAVIQIDELAWKRKSMKNREEIVKCINTLNAMVRTNKSAFNSNTHIWKYFAMKIYYFPEKIDGVTYTMHIAKNYLRELIPMIAHDKINKVTGIPTIPGDWTSRKSGKETTNNTKTTPFPSSRLI